MCVCGVYTHTTHTYINLKRCNDVLPFAILAFESVLWQAPFQAQKIEQNTCSFLALACLIF